MVLVHLLQMKYLIVAKPALQSACLASPSLHVAPFQSYAVLGVPAYTPWHCCVVDAALHSNWCDITNLNPSGY